MNISRRFLKHCINFFTAVGAGISTLSIYYSYHELWRTAWFLMGIAFIIDCLDGPVVRILNLERALPKFDGERLDEFADLLAYVVAPVCFGFIFGLFPDNYIGMITIMVVVGSSCLQFSRTNNKTDYAFWGWPSYWNIVYFYVWVLGIQPYGVVALSLLLSIGTMVPVPFVYPSKFPFLRRTTLLLNGIWLGILVFCLLFPSISDLWIALSLLYPLYYVSLSMYLYQYHK